MLGTACSLRGLALVHKSSGELHVYREAIKMFQASIRCLSFNRGRILVKQHSKLYSDLASLSRLLFVCSFAEKVENPELCLAAVKRYWNACLPLTRSPEERGRLHESLEKLLMLSVLVCSSRKAMFSLPVNCHRKKIMLLQLSHHSSMGCSIFTWH